MFTSPTRDLNQWGTGIHPEVKTLVTATAQFVGDFADAAPKIHDRRSEWKIG
jgi:hypothetical protein